MHKPKRFKPFHANVALLKKKAKAYRIKRKGFALPSDKASLRAIAQALETETKPR